MARPSLPSPGRPGRDSSPLPGRSARRPTLRSLRRKPWRRGPAAWSIACRAGAVAARVLAQPRRFLGLRRAARLLGLSTRPLRDWMAGGWLHRDAERGRITRDELVRFIQWLGAEARPFQDNRVVRLHARRGPPRRFGKLLGSGLSWPAGVAGLTPPELARLAGCHRSLVWQALRHGVLPGRRRSPRRWIISRAAWHRAAAVWHWPG